MYSELAEQFAAAASEAEAFNLLAQQPDTLGALLSIPETDAESIYRAVSRSRGTRPPEPDAPHPDVETRRMLARVTLAPAEADRQKADDSCSGSSPAAKR